MIESASPANSFAVSYEERPWQLSEEELAAQSRQSRELYAVPYRAAVPASLADADFSFDAGLLAEADDASAAIVRFDAERGSATAPFASILLRSESASSSELEHVTSTAREVAEAEIGERNWGNAALVVRNVRAMQAAIDLADNISNDSIIAMQGALLGDSTPAYTGRYRQVQVWISGRGFGPHNAAFMPPHPDRVPAAMDDLIAFIRRNDLPVLAQVAIAHAQFETIHPFPDGNGRTGRALVQSMLRGKGLTRQVTVPLSAGLLADVDAYFQALTAYRDGNVSPILHAFAEASFGAIRNGTRLAEDIEALRDSWADRLKGLRTNSAARRLAELTIEHPVVNYQLVHQRLDVSDQTAYNALAQLVERGVLQPGNALSRNRVWINKGVLDALDAFGRRAGRRGSASL